MKDVDIESMKKLFLDIKTSFSDLKMELETEPEHADLNMEIPKQEGLKFDVNVNLQGDELHLCVGGHFWLEWFPCTDQRKSPDVSPGVNRVLDFFQFWGG